MRVFTEDVELMGMFLLIADWMESLSAADS